MTFATFVGYSLYVTKSLREKMFMVVMMESMGAYLTSYKVPQTFCHKTLHNKGVALVTLHTSTFNNKLTVAHLASLFEFCCDGHGSIKTNCWKLGHHFEIIRSTKSKSSATKQSISLKNQFSSFSKIHCFYCP